ncbi:hypothetical protein Tco_1035399 [Tanacetum coccineum]
MKVEESLNVTFDESPLPTKLSPLVDDDIGEEEAIERKVKVDNNVENEPIEADEATQTALAIFTSEAEYVSARKACQQALWMKQALIDYDIRLDDILIM